MAATNETPDPSASQRIAKRIARAGLCSRREAETWIEAGRVQVNGRKITSPAINVVESDTVLVDGNPLPEAEPTRLWRYHKPPGLVVTARDEQGRPTIFDRLPDFIPRVMTVGRLDIASEGLLLLTNDGELARKLELPATGWLRRYRVRVRGIVKDEALAKLANGVTVDGVDYGAIHAEVESQQNSNAWLSVSLREGKNREVRRVMEHIGHPVSRLIRIAYGPFQLGALARGAVEEVSPKVLRDQMGRQSKGFAKAKPKPKKRPAASHGKFGHGKSGHGKSGDGKSGDARSKHDDRGHTPSRPNNERGAGRTSAKGGKR